MKIFDILSIIFLIFPAIFPKPTPSPKKPHIVYSLDCGSNYPHDSPTGKKFLADNYFQSGTIVADYRHRQNYNTIDIAYTDDDEVFRSERHGTESFIYQLPVTDSGIYVLILYFAELHFSKVKARVFHIKFGDSYVVQDLDIFDKVGKFSAHKEYIQFELKDDEIFVNNKLCSNAYKFKEKKLVVEFEKTEFDLPKVDGITLFKGKIEDTDYKEYQDIIAANIDKINQQKSESIAFYKRKEPKKELEVNDEGEEKPTKSILKLVFTGPGLIIMASIVALIIVYINMIDFEIVIDESHKDETSRNSPDKLKGSGRGRVSKKKD